MVGYALRPGFGMAGDEARVATLWRLWHAGPGHPGKAQVAADWWIMWRRVAGGLREGHQQQVGGALFKQVTGKGGEARVTAKGAQGQVLREQWRCLGALERLPVRRKTGLLKKIAEVPAREAHLYWVMARLGARRLLHGPENLVIPAAKIEPVLGGLLAEAPPDGRHARRLLALAIAAMCFACGVRTLDVAADVRERGRRRLAELGCADLAGSLGQTGVRERSEREELLGDSIPLGLRQS
jgi:hypothetical protein